MFGRHHFSKLQVALSYSQSQSSLRNHHRDLPQNKDMLLFITYQMQQKFLYTPLPGMWWPLTAQALSIPFNSVHNAETGQFRVNVHRASLNDCLSAAITPGLHPPVAEYTGRNAYAEMINADIARPPRAEGSGIRCW
jgi:hypothetical protein